MNTEDSEFERIEAEAKRRTVEEDDDTQTYTSESAEAYSYRCGYEAGAAAAIKKALAQPKPVAWKLVPIEPTNKMLQAMDECSKEGYDERLYAGHAASVYMAAVDVAPTPPQRPWQGLTDDEIRALASWWPSYDQMPALMVLAKDIQNSLKERNHG